MCQSNGKLLLGTRKFLINILGSFKISATSILAYTIIVDYTFFALQALNVTRASFSEVSKELHLVIVKFSRRQ